MHTLISVASRLFAIYLVLIAFRYSSYVFVTRGFTESIFAAITITLVAVAVPLAAAVFLWRKPLFVANTLLPKEPNEESPGALSESSLLTVLITLLGLYLVITGGAALVGLVVEYLAIRSAPNELLTTSPVFWSPIVRSALELGLGLVLIFRTNGLKQFYFSLKEGGRHEKNDSCQ